MSDSSAKTDNVQSETPEIGTDFRSRIQAIKPTRWLRFGIVSIIFLLWVAWLGTWWVALFEILLFDIYITGYIPLTWWKKSKNKTVRSVMSWVDAIVYALVLVYFIFAFIGQNYVIPSSSLEKTLLTGDYLWVNKVVYGPRVPMTPVHFPLVHNKMPFIGTDSYLDSPSLKYHRLKGLRNVETGDIVVFNFPAGDTVATKFEESPFYYDVLVEQYGRDKVHSDKETFGDIVYRPVDRRTNFVKRAVGLPGQNFRIVADTIYINGEKQAVPENAQFDYIYALTRPLTPELAHDLGITYSDIQRIPAGDDSAFLLSILGSPLNSHLYCSPLTQKMIAQLKADNILSGYVRYSDLGELGVGQMYPRGIGDGWSLSNWGGEEGVVIPAKGMTINLDERNWQLYQRCIRNYENHPDAYMSDGIVYIDGKPAKTYTFEMDYYFMMGDNRHRSQDSRFWGFVPEDHIVGTPMFVIASFDNERGLFDGKIRWNRVFRDANPDK